MQQVLIRSMLVRAVSGFSAPSASSARHMADLVVPAMGDSISEGTVSSVLKKIGESVTMDETLVQIETDKASAFEHNYS